MIMGDYNADADPDIDKIRQVAFSFELAPLGKLKIDQFLTDSDLKVYSLVQKIGSTRLLVLVDPVDLPQN
jgi:hypothetical protein